MKNFWNPWKNFIALMSQCAINLENMVVNNFSLTRQFILALRWNDNMWVVSLF